ncbi:class I SAM-dependent DNA methyltransferase [Actinomycetospora sp. CA-084318]|uniref:class I SAM-dependent DNA methyltransferase n=1 Tax=Actinomycetospora sp. CA-084318 TaxID=3239892 RepID=UPI003D9613FC
MEGTDWFGPAIAEAYDRDDDVRFTAEHLALEAGLLAELAGRGGRALEFAVGTGRVAVPLQQRGVEVHGIDLSAAMLAVLRTKTGDIPVVAGDFTTTRVPGRFDLVYLVFNTIGNVVTQEAQVATFANAAAHLRPSGRFVVETQIPGVARIGPTERFGVFRHDARGVGYDEYDRATQQMWSHHVSLGPDGHGRRRSLPFRYTWPAELDLMARLAGMTLQHRWAWWDRTPFTDTSRSHVSVWALPDENGE